MFKRSPAPFVPPIPPDVTSSSESSPVMRGSQLAPDQTGAGIGAIGRPHLSHHPSLAGVPPGSPAVFAQYPGPGELQELQEYQDMNMNMMMMQRWQQQQTRRPSAQGAAALRSPGPPGKEPVSAGARSLYGGGAAAAAQFAYAAAAAGAAPGPYGYGFSPYPQPSPYPYQAAGGFPFGGGMYGQPAAGYVSPYMTPLPTANILDPMGGGMPGGMGGPAGPRPGAMGGGGAMGAGMGALVPAGPSLIGRPGAAQEIVVTGKWLAGLEYAPALDNLLFTIVQPPAIELHPLLRPISETRDNTDPFLVFDILFPPNTIHLSTEPPRKSWSKGRKDPATFPRLKLIRLINQFTPWVIQVATDSDAGITVSDVINAVHEHFRINASQDDDWNSCDPGSQSEILMAYKWNRSTEMGAPGGIMPDALLRGDFLMERTMFAGIKPAEPDLTEQKMQVKNFPATFELLLHTR